jgi:MFS family permease
MTGSDHATTALPAPVGTWAPLRRPLFRALWLAQVASLVGTWAQTVGAQWFLTETSGRPEVIALVQTATSLPVLVLALPAGVLADLVDRRRILLLTQVAMAVVAAALAVVAFAGWLTPVTLLIFTALLGVGVAVTSPAWQASVPELVSRPEVASAAALNGIAINLARSVGPALGGLIVSVAGVAWVFAFNALTYLAWVGALWAWRAPPVRERHEGERLGGGMRLALAYVRNSPAMQRVLTRTALWVVPATALWALLPVVAATRLNQGSTGYGGLLGALGVGAVAGAAGYGWLRAHLTLTRLLAVAGGLYALAMVVLAVSRSVLPVVPVLVVAGASWTCVLATLNSTAQLLLPGWVRARALATYLVVFFGGQALGSAAWGALAGAVSTGVALLSAAGALLAGTLTLRLIRLPDPAGMDPGLSTHWPEPTLVLDTDSYVRPMLVTVEYRVPAADVVEFVAAMEYVARSRRRTGARRWGLYRDGAEPDRFLETYQVASWAEHLRQHDERLTVSDRHREDAAHRLVVGAPRVSHLFPA